MVSGGLVDVTGALLEAVEGLVGAQRVLDLNDGLNILQHGVQQLCDESDELVLAKDALHVEPGSDLDLGGELHIHEHVGFLLCEMEQALMAMG